MFSNENTRKPIAATKEGEQKNITIKGIGKAILNGGNHNGLYEVNGIERKVSKYPDHRATENCMLYFQNIKNLVIENITIKDHCYRAICLFTIKYSHFSNISYDKDCKPLKDDEHIHIEWNNTRSEGFNCVYFNGAEVKNVVFDNIGCASGMDNVFGGFGTGALECRNVKYDSIKNFSAVKGIEINNK